MKFSLPHKVSYFSGMYGPSLTSKIIVGSCTSMPWYWPAVIAEPVSAFMRIEREALYSPPSRHYRRSHQDISLTPHTFPQFGDDGAAASLFPATKHSAAFAPLHQDYRENYDSSEILGNPSFRSYLIK